MTTPRRGSGATAARVLDTAERLVQTRGFNAVSYADIAAEVGITKAALHYHFHGKAELGAALVNRYTARFTAALEAIDRDLTATPAKIAAYAGIYVDVLRDHRMCLCGMLAAEYQTLPSPMQNAIVNFFDINEAWLEAVLDDGQQKESAHYRGSAREAARMIIGSLEGAMLVARLHDDVTRLEITVDQMLTTLSHPTP